MFVVRYMKGYILEERVKLKNSDYNPLDSDEIEEIQADENQMELELHKAIGSIISAKKNTPVSQCVRTNMEKEIKMMQANGGIRTAKQEQLLNALLTIPPTSTQCNRVFFSCF